MTITADPSTVTADDTPVNRGEVFTQRWVVELVLDLCGYNAGSDLTRLRLLDPAVGNGAFLLVALDRLLQSRAEFRPRSRWSTLTDALTAVDVQEHHVESCRHQATAKLMKAGCPEGEAVRLADGWVRQADFLLDSVIPAPVDVVVGNPPYVRIEDIPAPTLAAYRKACRTMTGRADIYIGFYERGLEVLSPDGRLGFICADRWMRNQYGRGLRAKLTGEGFAVDACLVMHDVAAFEEDVSAYPAVTILRRGKQSEAVVGDTTGEFDGVSARTFASWALQADAAPLVMPSVSAARLPHWHDTVESWPAGSPAILAWLEDLQDRFPVLEEESTGTRIRIGVATGADAVYVTREPAVAEEERMLPLAMAADIKTGAFAWTGARLVNPWDSDGLVDIDDWPQLRTYLEKHRAAVRGRLVARNNPRRWYRTIDRVTMSVTAKPKLLLEDLKAKANPVLEPGGHYPHHNLYYVVSDAWDLEVLGGLLLSEVVEQQVAAYCVKMRGRTLRFQAQYLRRVRVPQPQAISGDIAEALKDAFKARDREAATSAALAAYGLNCMPR